MNKPEQVLVAKQGDTISLLNLFQCNFDCEELKEIALKENSNVNDQVIESIIGTWTSYSVLELIAEHPETPIETLKTLSKSNCGHVRVKAKRRLLLG
jgi:hypothetical protein